MNPSHSRYAPFDIAVHLLTNAISLAIVLMFAACVSGAHAQGSPDWQQRVEYEMDIILDVRQHGLEGHQILRYHNNSPDTLDRVFYHLYFNAFNPHSAMAERNRQLPDPDSRIVPRIFELGPDEVGFHRIDGLSQNGVPVGFRIRDTVMEVTLATPIPPGSIAEFVMDFTSQIPLQTRRSGRDNREGIDYSMTQWYPKIANYDSRGWHADPYVGREFYAPFGAFDVRITLPAEYVIGATGVLQNPEQIGHGYASAPAGPATDDEFLTWHFTASDVHDFAWAADPDYVHDVIERGGIQHHLFYQPDVAENWARLHEWLPMMIEFFSERYGPYPYPQVTVIQGGDGGMEYPMITLITGRRSPPSLLGVTVHEMAHMWYYGILGNNESKYAWLDEGFASYIQTEFQSFLAGRPPTPHLNAQYGVLWAQDRGIFEPINTPSDWFRTNTAYSVASYQGGDMVLDMLGYVISDSLRDQFLLEYYDRFRFRHPNPYDVEKVAEDVSGIQLDWYFDQFTRTDWHLDYAVDRVSNRRKDDGWATAIRLERKGDIAMPVDLLVTYEGGDRQWITIPLSDMHGSKPVPVGWIVADPWIWTSPEYELEIRSPQRVRRVEIDPAVRTPDANRLNNRNRFPAELDFMQPARPSMTRYSVGWRPAVQFAHAFGPGAGMQFRGAYLFDRYKTRLAFTLWPQVLLSDGDEPQTDESVGSDISTEASWIDGIDFDLHYSDRAPGFGPYGVWSLSSEKHLGILQNRVEFSTPLRQSDLLTEREHRLTLGLRHQVRTSPRAQIAAPAFGFIADDLLSAVVAYVFSDDRRRLELRAEVGGAVREEFPSVSANKFYVDAARAAGIGPFTGGARLRIGTGAENLATQKRFRLGTATYEERWENDAFRSIAAILEAPLEDAHWVAFSGPGPIALARDELPVTNGFVVGSPSGSHTLAASAVLVFKSTSPSQWLSPFRSDLFVGIGKVWDGSGFLSGLSFSEMPYDVGFGFRYNLAELPPLRRWTAQSDVLSSLHLTARFPLWAGTTWGGGSEKVFDFRWLIGITTDYAPWY